MSYSLTEITIRTNDSENHIKDELWTDVESGKISLLFTNTHEFIRNVSPVSKYSNYDRERIQYDFSIKAVHADFFKEMEQKIKCGSYIKIETRAECETENEATCACRAWKIAREKEMNGEIKRAYTEDFESSVPKEYTKDGKAHCYLYISVQNGKAQ